MKISKLKTKDKGMIYVNEKRNLQKKDFLVPVYKICLSIIST